MADKSKIEKEKQREHELKRLRQELEDELLEQLEEQASQGAPLSVQQFKEPAELSEADAKRVIEAILFASAKPMTVAELKKVVKGFSAQRIEQIVRELHEEYLREGRSFGMNEVAGGYEVSTDPKFAPWIMKLELQKKARQATQSALETLAILAYKQPITRAEIEDLRGVDVSGVVSTLLERNLIKIVGRKEVPGRPYLYGTTEKFLEHFGLKSLSDLPNISEIRTLVEKSVRKEDLLRTERMIPVEQTQAAAQPDPNQAAEAEVEPSESSESSSGVQNEP